MFKSFGVFGLNALMHRRHRESVLVLTYHGVIPESHERDRFRYHNTVSISEFERHLRLLSSRFHPISLIDLRAWVEAKTALPPHSVLVTFDDGFRNNLKYAAPLLTKYAVPAVIFISTGYIGERRILWPEEVVLRVMQWPLGSIHCPDREGDFTVSAVTSERRRLAERVCKQCKRLPVERLNDYLAYLRSEVHLDPVIAEDNLYAFLTWDEVRALRRQGIEFGSHTVEHMILSRLPADQLKRELCESKARIEKELGVECFSLAYPDGSPKDCSPTVVEAVHQAGYALSFTVANDFQYSSGNPLMFSRVIVPGHVDQAQFEAHVCGTHGFVRSNLERFLGEA